MRRWWWLLLVLLVLAGGAYAFTRTRGNAASEPARWRTATVTRGDLLVSISASGSVRPAAEVEVRSRATGVVTDVLVDEGQRVTVGQVLALIDDPDAGAAVRAAQANLDAAVARLGQVEAQRTAQTAEDVAAVRQAQASVDAAKARLQNLLAGARPEEVAQAEEAVRVAAAALALVQKDSERSEQLFRDGFISQQQLDLARAQLDQARAQHQSALERLNLVKAGATADQIAEARATVRQAEAALEQARARQLEEPVRQQQIAAARAEVRQARTGLANAESRLAETRIRAPVAGVVVKRSIEVGQSVIGGTAGSGTAVLSLAVDTPVLATVMVDETDIAQLRAGIKAEVRADGLPEETFTGVVTAVAPTSQLVSNVVQYAVTVEVTDPQRRLRFGMSVEAEFILMQRRGVVLVPREALRGEQTRAVMIVEGERLVPRVVRTGGTDGRMVEILEGVREGETLYLGEARTQQSAPAQPRNPFAPNLPRRATPAPPPPPPGHP